MKMDLTGQRFGKLVVTGEAVATFDVRVNPNKTPTAAPMRARVTRYWYCTCDCGKKTKVKQDNLRSGLSKSCGCNRGWLANAHTKL